MNCTESCYENVTWGLVIYVSDLLIRELYPSHGPSARWHWVRYNFDGQIIERYERVAGLLGVPNVISAPFIELVKSTGDEFFRLPHYACLRNRLKETVNADDPTTAPFRLHLH